MAIATTRTRIPLDTWAEIIGLNPVHFNGAVGASFFSASACDVVWTQHAWQSEDQYLSREDVARLLAKAETDVFDMTHIWPRPHYVRHTKLVPSNRILDLNNGYEILQVGTLSYTALDESASVGFLDEDDDGYYETVVVTTGAYLTGEPRLYFAGHNLDPAWEIRPISRIVTGTTQTQIYAPAHLFFNPTLWLQKPVDGRITPIDADDSNSYVSEVAVGLEMWTQNGVTVTPVCAETQSTVDLLTYPIEYGIVHLYANNCAIRAGDTVTLYARVGLDAADPVLDALIADMVLARMYDAPCACTYIIRKYAELRRDSGMPEGRTGVYLPQRLIGSPFGSRMGEINAWRKLAELGYQAQYSGGLL